MEELKVAPIRNGTVIDHIKAGQALNVLKILGVNENTVGSTIILAMHVFSKKDPSGWKDVVKVEDRELDENTVSKIALIAPNATIVIIRDYYVAEKYTVNIGDHVKGLAKCSNPNCITNVGEPVEPEFDVVSRDPPVLRCMYCERCMSNISENLL
ncbi:MAG: aspartate carbamoyltransferase regulatory subunit [Candidatus Methanomethylophilaceae archaeon]|nr:aspartate carbamoyltransferase regulatory subunit [Candidatus Methanomethylophilaceae archaeon]MBQ6547909.1 aspartate carbamoyltransferase regulatory subunit [Candidatus Methanomethylophilaceae archaeon]